MVTDKLIRFVTAGKKDIPNEARDTALRLLADCLGCGIAAVLRGDTGSSLVMQQVLRQGGAAEASILGHKANVPAAQAALVNATLCHALDYDDYTLSSWIGHPSVVLFPALLAVAERDALSGQAVLDAWIMGYEVGARLGLAAGQAHYAAGWHNTSTIGTIAATAAITCLLQLPAEQCRSSVGLAASMSGGLKRNFGTMAKPLHAGLAARSAVEAVELAVSGLSASDEVLCGTQGWLACLSGGQDDYDAAWRAQLDTLGRHWDLLDPGVGIKPYPSCAYSHWVIDAAIQLANQDVVPEAVEQVEICCSHQASQVCIYNAPRTALEGKFSLPYCFALGLSGRSAGLDDFLPQPIQDEAILGIMARVNVVPDSHWEQQPWGGHVICRLKDGSRLQISVPNPTGSPGNPASEQVLRKKISDCFGDPAKGAEFYDQVIGFESMPVRDFLGALKASVLQL